MQTDLILDQPDAPAQAPAPDGRGRGSALGWGALYLLLVIAGFVAGWVFFAPTISDAPTGDPYRAQYHSARDALVWSYLGAGIGALVAMAIALRAGVRWFFVPLAVLSTLILTPFVLVRETSDHGTPDVGLAGQMFLVLYWISPFVFALGPVLAARLALRRPWGTPPPKVRPRGFLASLLAVVAAAGGLVVLAAGLYAAILGGGGSWMFGALFGWGEFAVFVGMFLSLSAAAVAAAWVGHRVGVSAWFVLLGVVGFFAANAFNGSDAMLFLTLVIVLPLAAAAIAVRAGWVTRLLLVALVAAGAFGVHQALIAGKNEGIRAESATPTAEFRRVNADTVGPVGRDDLVVIPLSVRQETDGTVADVEYQVALRGTAAWVRVRVGNPDIVRCNTPAGEELDIRMVGDKPRSVCRTLGAFNADLTPADWDSLDIPFDLVQLGRDLGPTTTRELADLAERR